MWNADTASVLGSSSGTTKTRDSARVPSIHTIHQPAPTKQVQPNV